MKLCFWKGKENKQTKNLKKENYKINKGEITISK